MATKGKAAEARSAILSALALVADTDSSASTPPATAVNASTSVPCA